MKHEASCYMLAMPTNPLGPFLLECWPPLTSEVNFLGPMFYPLDHQLIVSLISANPMYEVKHTSANEEPDTTLTEKSMSSAQQVSPSSHGHHRH